MRADVYELATSARSPTAVRATSRLAERRTVPRGLRGEAKGAGGLAGGAPDRRIGFLDAQIGSFVPDGIRSTAKLTGAPRGRVITIVLAQERDLGTAPRAATVSTAGGLGEAARRRATEITILLRSHWITPSLSQ